MRPYEELSFSQLIEKGNHVSTIRDNGHLKKDSDGKLWTTLMTKRDNFSPAVKNAIALRSGYRCSFTGCDCLTVGPSDESEAAVASTGVAAHIHAASSGKGARRYLATMTPEERSGIGNAIWMCATHATLIDRDESTYTATVLKQMKAEHERRIESAHSGVQNQSNSLSLIGLGPEVIATGELVGISGLKWTVRIDHFVSGDINSIIKFGESFATLNPSERFVLINALGDGRCLARAPVYRIESNVKYLDLEVETSFPRITAQSLKKDIALLNNDLSITNGQFGVISGLDALPQKIQLNLGMQQGESPFHPKHGSRTGEFFQLFGNSVWFQELIKLELIRLASIPILGAGTDYLPFQCVEKVISIQLLADQTVNSRIPAKISLMVKGVGQWEHQIELFVPVT